MKVLLLALLLTGTAAADEGLWLPDHPPALKLSKAWFAHLQACSLRFNNGGSGAFVSARGLVMTNQHVVEAFAPRQGFVGERRCPGLELDQLESVRDITAEVEKGGDAAVARLERGTSQVVSLYRGCRFALYRYHRYTDVRLLFAPPLKLAFAGGQAANFEWPRYSLDVALLRVYEHGRPAHTPFLRCGRAHIGDQVVVCGNPGQTERLATIDELDQLRRFGLPRILAFYAGRIRALLHCTPQCEQLFVLENAQKAMRGRLDALSHYAGRGHSAALARACRERSRLQPAYRAIARGLAFNCASFARARARLRGHALPPSKPRRIDLCTLTESLKGVDPKILRGRTARTLLDGGMDALVREIEPTARKLQHQMEAVQARIDKLYQQIARQHGFGGQPEGSFSLRFSYGNIREATPIDFTTTADISDGSSGSPVVNRLGKLVGIIFDVDHKALGWHFHYDPTGRSLAVDLGAIRKALPRELASELTGTN